MGADRTLRELHREIENATTWNQWHEAASELDRHEGLDAWMADDESPWLESSELRRHAAELGRLRELGDAGGVEALVTEGLLRHLGDVVAPPLYGETHTGETKRVVTEWLEACISALDWLVTAPIPGLSRAARRARFVRAAENLGTTALMLSGGGAWGLYHLGVVSALRTAGILPRVICGSSMGAIVAAGVATRTDEELDAFYAQPDRIHRTAIRLLGPTGIRTHRALLDPGTLRDHVASNIGDFTFLEAHVRTGRVLNVSISPTRARQKPRVLSHRTAPDVLIVDATVASCSIPGLFPPVSLRARGADGRTEPYVPTEKWVDGSMHGDLPMQRLARLHNVNHFIVSQANPFVLPFVAMPHHGPLRTAMRLAGSVARAQAAAVLDEVRLRVHGGRLRPWLDTAHALAGQAYGAEINIHPRVTPAQYPRVMSNPTEPELRGYIVGGERATWPRIPLIRVQTAIARTLESCIDRLAAEP